MPLVLSGTSGISTNGTNWALQPDSSGRVKQPNQPSFLVRLSSANAVAAGIVTLAWNNKVFDQNNNFNTSTYTFTAPVAGQYLFGYQAYLGSNSGSYYGFQPVYNGGNQDYIFNNGFSDTGVVGTCLLNMAANDTFTVRGYCSTSATYYTSATFFYGYLVN